MKGERLLTIAMILLVLSVTFCSRQWGQVIDAVENNPIITVEVVNDY